MIVRDQSVRDRCVEISSCEGLMFADGYDDCVVGVTDGTEPKVVYDREKILEKLAAENKDKEDPHLAAIEHFEFNILGSYVGEHTPIYVSLLKEGE